MTALHYQNSLASTGALHARLHNPSSTGRIGGRNENIQLIHGKSTYTEEKPPLYTAFAMATKRPVNENQSDREEELWEGAD
ncbi:hypothetical protein KF707_16210 [Candidatus Obscuribacterales bacterium]|nr:hypothetical protein [Candidatus Obscuribacterales bacterium]